MAQSLALVLVHIIFSTKNRSPLLPSTEVRSQAHADLTETLRALDCAPLEVGGVADHVHILCGLSRKISLSELVKNLKTSSSKILKGKVHDGFSWQNGYGAFSVSQSARKSVFIPRGPGNPASQDDFSRGVSSAAKQTRNPF